jgi:hypothetical protein
MNFTILPGVFSPSKYRWLRGICISRHVRRAQRPTLVYLMPRGNLLTLNPYRIESAWRLFASGKLQLESPFLLLIFCHYSNRRAMKLKKPPSTYASRSRRKPRPVQKKSDRGFSPLLNPQTRFGFTKNRLESRNASRHYRVRSEVRWGFRRMSSVRFPNSSHDRGILPPRAFTVSLRRFFCAKSPNHVTKRKIGLMPCSFTAGRYRKSGP